MGGYSSHEKELVLPKQAWVTPTDLMSNKLEPGTQRANAPGVLLHEVQEQAKLIYGETSQSGHLCLGRTVLTGRGLRSLWGAEMLYCWVSVVMTWAYTHMHMFTKQYPSDLLILGHESYTSIKKTKFKKNWIGTSLVVSG